MKPLPHAVRDLGQAIKTLRLQRKMLTRATVHCRATKRLDKKTIIEHASSVNKPFRTAIASILVLLQSLASAEFAGRVFWYLRFGISPFYSNRVLYAYYPELRRVDNAHPRNNDDVFDILILGASTMNRGFGNVEQEIREQLANAGNHNVRIFNLAKAAQTSRDALLQYQALENARFDVVVFYAGINDVRANNAPPEVFKKDYSHYSWYENVNALAPYHRNSRLALPFTALFLINSTRRVFSASRYAPAEDPRPEWIQYGKDLRGTASFEENLKGILDLAATRGDTVLLATFAFYIPEDYTLEGFRHKRLNYVLHRSPVEIWGSPENVRDGIEAYNNIIRREAASRKKVLFVDEAMLMPRKRIYFNDVCHFTAAGSTLFVEPIAKVLSGLQAAKTSASHSN
jgi:lysophospholipase L1-like esterase